MKSLSNYIAESAASTHELETALYKFVESLVKADSKEKFDAVIDDFESKYADNKIKVDKVPMQFTNWDTLVYVCKNKNLDGKKGVSYVCIDCFNADELTCEYKVMTYGNKFNQRAGLYDESQDDDADYTPMYLVDEYSTDLNRGSQPQFYLFKNVTNKILY